MSAINYTDSATAAELRYGREQDELFDAYEKQRMARCREHAEEDATFDLCRAEDNWREDLGLNVEMFEKAENAICRLAAFAVRPDLMPADYADKLYQRDSERVQGIIEQWIEDRAEAIRRGEV